MIEYHKMTEAEKRIISDWKYPNEYAVYNLPSYEQQQKQQFCFCSRNSDKKFNSYYEDGVLVGFTNILEEETEICIGIGVNPNLCGTGYGKRILEIVAKITKERFPSKPEYLEVRTWNERAIRCYKSAGFQIDGESFEQKTLMGVGEFYRMVRR